MYKLIDIGTMCRPKGYGFSAVLVVNRVWILQPSLEMHNIFKKKPLFHHYQTEISKSPSQIMLRSITSCCFLKTQSNLAEKTSGQCFLRKTKPTCQNSAIF